MNKIRKTEEKPNQAEERIKGDDRLSGHVIRSLGSTIYNVEDQYASRSNLQAPLGIAPNLISRYQERKESNNIFTQYEAHKTRIVEILRRRLL